MPAPLARGLQTRDRRERAIIRANEGNRARGGRGGERRFVFLHGHSGLDRRDLGDVGTTKPKRAESSFTEGEVQGGQGGLPRKAISATRQLVGRFSTLKRRTRMRFSPWRRPCIGEIRGERCRGVSSPAPLGAQPLPPFSVCRDQTLCRSICVWPSVPRRARRQDLKWW